MKTNAKKVPRIFRLQPRLDMELRQRSIATGISQTRMVEDALDDYFDTMRVRLERTARKLSSFLVPDPRQVRIHILQALAA